MDTIEEYFQGEYIVEKNKIKEIDELVNDVIKSLIDSAPQKNIGWPYELSAIDGFNQDHEYSFSTNAMILFLLAKFKGGIIHKGSPLLPSIGWDLDTKLRKEIDNINVNEYFTIFNEHSLGLNAKYLTDDDKQVSDLVSVSGSFGFNDPFTLSWITELFKEKTSAHLEEDPLQNIKTTTYKEANKIVKKSFDNPEEPLLQFGGYKKKEGNNEESKRKASNHIFPLLGVIHLYKSLSNVQKIEDNAYSITNILTNLQNRINQQVSHYTVQNSLFDTAELVMSLEGMLLLDENRRIDENLIRKVFEILSANQKNNLNWRPLKPFVTSPQGDVLLPLSIEIANSLLRICKLLEKSKRYYFHDYSEIFNNYTQWLLANVSQCTIDGKVYKGWRSEHVQVPDVIHPWETAQVLIYLMTFKSMIQERIAHKSLKKSGLTCYDKYVKKGAAINTKTWTIFFDTDIQLGYENSYKDILDKFILEREKESGNPSYSMLLFGPPGTGKSTIAEQLAESLNWRLITITPSDFIKHGEADIEGRAKSIFKTLEEQQNCVILFDEIDRLILDRDSSYYLQQGDFYQFMTPSMLVKFKDLRTKEKSIFVVATNYAERIDSAIKRSGRIDEKYLINTLNAEQRKNLILKITKDKGGSFNNINNLVKESCFLSYTELSSLVKSAIKGTSSGEILDNILIKKIDTNPPTIKLSNYKRRFQEDIKVTFDSDERKVEKIDSTIYPYKEFLALVYLKLESGNQLKPDELEIIERIKRIPGFNIDSHFSKDSDVYKKINDLFIKK